MPKTKHLVRPHIRLQKLQREVRKQFGTYKSTYLARVDGTVRLPGGLFWTHDANGVDANGNTTYGAPRKMPMLAGAAIIPRPNTKVDIVTVQGVDYIARTNAGELERMGVDPHQSNTLDPAAQFTSLDWVTNLQAFKTPGVAATHIIGSIYEKPDGTYDVFPTTGGYDFVTANIPSVDTQVVVCQWLDTDTNTVSATVSSEVSRDIDLKHKDNLADTMTLINECAAAASANAIGVTAWRIYDDTTISTLNDTNKLADLRGIVGVGGSGTGGGYTTIEDEGSSLTQRTTINFVGAGVNAADSGGKTVVTIPGVSDGTALIDVPQAYLVGFEFDYDGTTFTVQPGACRNDDDTYTIVKTTTTTINPATTGAGALDTGSLASNTWYYVWVIAKSSDGTTSALLSTSSASPTLPSGYDKKRRVGSIKTKAAAATLLKMWTERGAGCNRKFIYIGDFTNHRDDTGTTITSAGTYYTCTVTHAPPTSRSVGLTFSTSGAVRLYVCPNGLETTNGGFDIYISGSTQYSDIDHIPITSSQQFTVTRSGGSSVVLGWITRWYQDSLVPAIVGVSAPDTVQAATITTSNNSPTTLTSIATSTDIAYTVEAVVTARRTGGGSGSAGDGATYKIVGSFKNVAGTLTQRGSTAVLVTVEDQAGWDATFDVSGTDIRIRVTGATNNNISWSVRYTVSYV